MFGDLDLAMCVCVCVWQGDGVRNIIGVGVCMPLCDSRKGYEYR